MLILGVRPQGNVAIDATVINQTAVLAIGDKEQVEAFIGELERISERDPDLYGRLQQLYLVLSSEVTVTRLRLIIEMPATCQFDECVGIDNYLVVNLAVLVRTDRGESDKDVVSKDGRAKGRVADAGGSTTAGVRQIAYRVQAPTVADKSAPAAQVAELPAEVAPEPVVLEPEEPAAADPWWKGWLEPLYGLLTVIILGATGWYGIQHQRHQMRRDQQADAMALATIPGVGALADVAAGGSPPLPRPRTKLAKTSKPANNSSVAANGPAPSPRRPTAGSTAAASRRSRSRSPT